MKKITFMLIAAFLVVASWAGVPVKKATPLQPQKAIQMGALKKAPKSFKAVAPFTMKTPAINRLAAKAKANVRKAPKKEGINDLLASQWMLCSDYYEFNEAGDDLVEATPASGGTPISITVIDQQTVSVEGFTADATEPIQATFTMTTDPELLADGVIFEVSIPSGQLLRETEYGPVYLTNVTAENEGDPIKGYVLSQGMLALEDLWAGILGGDGEYAGYLWTDYIYESVAVPSNGKMAFSSDDNGEEEVPVYIYQDADNPKVATVYNFGGYEAAVDINLKDNQSFVIPDQPLFYYNSNYGYFYVGGLLISGGQYYLDTLTGVGTETTLTFDGNWMVYSPTKGAVFSVYNPATTITMTEGEFAYPVIPDVAATPATPEIQQVSNFNPEIQYGFITFTIPTTDVDGNDLKEDKLFYQLYSDINGDIQPIVFTPDLYENLDEDMSIIPYAFTDHYDFDEGDGYKVVFLNYNFNAMYDRIGVKSIYMGGGETNSSEIAWADVEKDEPAGPEVATFNFNKMDVATSATGVNDGDITEALALTEGAVTLTVSPSTSNTPNRFWSTSAGPQLRVYSGTLTFEVPEGKVITQIVFNHNGKWGANTVEGEAIPNDAEAKAATWTGEAQTVVVAIAANSQINSIDVTVGKDASIAGFDFEDGTLQGWTTIDADGDGYDWTVYSGNSGNAGHNGSTTAVMSQSYANGVGALTPDNYLVSPKVKLEGALMFYACAQDASYPAEHFGVLVSTKGNTDPEDFEMLQEWTMTASRTDSQPASARGIFRSPSKVQGNWYQYIVDLSSFEGQEGYVAIRHFNCTDMFYLLVDDITFGPAPDFIITPAEGVVESFTDFDIKFNNYDITLAEDASASLYNETTMSTYATNGFTIKDNTLHVSFAESFGEIAEPGNYTLSITGVKNEEGEVALEFYYTIEEKPELVELPEGVEPEEFTLTATGAVNSVFGWSEQTVEETRLVAFDGNDVYVQGLAAQYFPDGFVKGTLNENNQVVFKSGQLVGEDEEGLEFIVGFTVDEESNIIYEPEFVFDFDAETRTLTLADDFYVGESAYADQAGIYAYLEEAVYTEGGLVLPPLVELPEGVEAQAWALEGFFSDGESGNDVARAAEVAFDGNDIYVKGLSYYFEEAWLKGTVADGIATFPSGQFVGRDEYGKEFMMGFDDEDICDIEYAYDAEAKTLKQVTKYVADNNGEEELNPWGFWVYSIFYDGEPAVQEPVALPEGLQTESYLFTAMEISTSEDDEEADDDDETSGIEMESYSTQVEVAFDGSDVYFQGFTSNTTDMWMKGTLSEDGKTVTIPANQYMGFISSWFSIYDFYVAALTDDLEGFEDIVLNYDAENNRFSTDQIIATNGSKFLVYPYQVFSAVEIEKIAEFAATPADPEIDEVDLQNSLPKAYFNIPAKDTEGNVLLASKLFYTVWVEKDGVQQPYTVTAAEYTYVDEDMVEIPYNYDDNYDIYRGGSLFYFNPTEEAKTFTNVGIQSIYYGGGERNATDIIWLDGTITTGIKDINTANAAVYFDLQGRKVTGAQKGLLIKQTEQNGVVKTVKVVRK